jgi:hypothetical protein
MVMKLDKVVPFGRSFTEYVKMFNLSSQDLQGKILGVGDGPASFNATATGQKCQVISIDPVYNFSGEEIKQRFDAVVDNIIAQVRATPDDWVWTYHQSPKDLQDNRQQVLKFFLADYDLGKKQGRYIIGELPQLNFPEQTFDLVLCSHLLFLYSEQFNYQFHLESIQEMLRVSREVRIFPLLTLMLQKSPYLDRIMSDISSLGYSTEIIQSDYEFQKGGNEMLVISRDLKR